MSRLAGRIRRLERLMGDGDGPRVVIIWGGAHSRESWVERHGGVLNFHVRLPRRGDNAMEQLPTDLSDDLAAYVATRAPGEPVLPLPRRGRGAEMLHVDLAAANIPYRDAADFHSLRCETATVSAR
jgi:hypothetical protein